MRRRVFAKRTMKTQRNKAERSNPPISVVSRIDGVDACEMLSLRKKNKEETSGVELEGPGKSMERTTLTDRKRIILQQRNKLHEDTHLVRHTHKR